MIREEIINKSTSKLFVMELNKFYHIIHYIFGLLLVSEKAAEKKQKFPKKLKKAEKKVIEGVKEG